MDLFTILNGQFKRKRKFTNSFYKFKNLAEEKLNLYIFYSNGTGLQTMKGHRLVVFNVMVQTQNKFYNWVCIQSSISFEPSSTVFRKKQSNILFILSCFHFLILMASTVFSNQIIKLLKRQQNGNLRQPIKAMHAGKLRVCICSEDFENIHAISVPM